MTMPKGLIILGDLLDQDLIWLARNGDVRRMAKGDVLIHGGRDIAELFFVTDGKFGVTIGTTEVAEVGVGDVLGEMSFVEKRAPGATVAAKGDARVLAVPRDTLLAEFRTNAAFSARFYRALAVFLSDRLRSMTQGADSDELDEALLDTIHIAGDRMLRLIGLLEGELQPG